MEERLSEIVHVLVLIVETFGAAVIAIGALWAFVRFVWAGLQRRGTRAFVPVRIAAMAASLPISSNDGATAVVKMSLASWNSSPRARNRPRVRTALNYFLSKEIAEERRQLAALSESGGPSR